MTFYEYAYWGSVWDFGWLGFYDFFERIGIVKHEQFNQFKNLIDCGIYDMIQQNEICFVCGMPKYILRNEQGNLHSTEKPAIRWKDGFELYFIHGVTFDKELFKKAQTMKARDIVAIKNIEQRMALLKEYGAERILKELNARLIDKSKRGNELYAIDGLTDKTEKILKYQCPSTQRVYTKFVKPEYNKADDAQANSHHFTLENYQLLKVET